MRMLLRTVLFSGTVVTLAAEAIVIFSLHRRSPNILALRKKRKPDPRRTAFADRHREEIEGFRSLPKERAVIISDDGLKLVGYLTENRSHRYALCFHGFRGNHHEIERLAVASYFQEQGYRVLLVDQRSHGESEGTFIGMGWLERKDVLAWMNFIRQRDPEAAFVLYGESMGAATVLAAMGLIDDSVKAVIADSGYDNVYDVLSYTARYRFRLPRIPFMSAASLLAKVQAGYSFKEGDILAGVKNSQAPLLLFAGTADVIVPYENTLRLAQAAGVRGEMHITEGAGHVQSAFFRDEEYFAIITAFLAGK